VTPGPLNLTIKVHSPVKLIPSRVSRHLLTARPVGRVSTPLRFPVPSTVSPCEPHMERAVNLAPVPLSGFHSLSAVSWQARVSRPCFVPQPFLGSSLQSFPLAKSAHPSRGHCSLAAIHQHAETYGPGPCYQRFPRRPRLHAVAWFPRWLWVPFSQTRMLTSRSPWVPDHGPPRSARFTCFGALLPLRVRSHWIGLPFTSGRCSPGFFFPSGAFSSRASGPVLAQTTSA
jgi:hypothetical protein